jgi:hypothetical protein
MSARNRLDAKRARRARRTLRKGRLDTYIDLLSWMKMRAPLTSRECRAVALSGALRVDSHKVGIAHVTGSGGIEMKLFQRFVPTAMVGPAGKNIQILKPEELDD